MKKGLPDVALKADKSTNIILPTLNNSIMVFSEHLH